VKRSAPSASTLILERAQKRVSPREALGQLPVPAPFEFLYANNAFYGFFKFLVSPNLENSPFALFGNELEISLGWTVFTSAKNGKRSAPQTPTPTPPPRQYFIDSICFGNGPSNNVTAITLGQDVITPFEYQPVGGLGFGNGPNVKK